MHLIILLCEFSRELSSKVGLAGGMYFQYALSLKASSDVGSFVFRFYSIPFFVF